MIYIQTKQSVFPKAIYIGDKAELRCSFKSDSVLETGRVAMEAFIQSLDYTLYDIKEMSVMPAQAGTYNLVINFVPWHTGVIQLPDYELEGIGTIHFEGIQVQSLVEQQNASGLRSYSSPLLLPGTAYKIYGGIAVFIILLILIIRLIVKWRSVVFWIKNARLRRRYSRSRKHTIKALKKLEQQAVPDNKNMDSQLCTEIQKLMREYLELRLDYPFTKVLTSELAGAFETATCGMSDEEKSVAFENIISAFVRTDFIRFSDSYNAHFEQGELHELIGNLIAAIDVIEGKDV